MIDFEVLKEFGTTNERISEVCRAEHGTKDHETRQKLEEYIESKVIEGVQFNLRSYHPYAASDLAWDGQVYNETTIPLLLYAQGKVGVKEMVGWCKDSGMTDDQMGKFCKKDKDGKEFISADIGKFVEVSMNMVRSFVQRRHAAQVARYSSQYPFLKYETYDRSYEAQLKADAISQRIEIMANQYGYRHQQSQIIRDFLLYPHVVEFPAESWHCEKQYRAKRGEGGEYLSAESYIVREGVPYVIPHPSRVFYDIASPLSSINSDTGCDFFGYWEVARYGDIRKNTAYFNRDNITSSANLGSFLRQNTPYLRIYYPGRMEWPGFEGENSPATRNDREANIGLYSTDHDDCAVVLTEFRMKLIPKDWGFGKYPYPVWVRFVVASEKTIIHAEIMPGCPAHYYGYNVKDNRLYNNSFAHEIMPYQDQMSNLLGQMLLSIKQSLLKVLLLNQDLLDPEDIEEIKKIISGDLYFNRPVVVGFKADRMAQLGKSQDTIKLVGTEQPVEVQNIVRAMIELNVFAERMLNFSPQELGQPAPRVTSATEIVEMASSVATLYNFVSKGIDEGLAAKKRYLYEALVSLSEGEMKLPVMNQYPGHVIEEAGFKHQDYDDLKDGSKTKPRGHIIIGKYRDLVYDYNFNAKEGGDRTQNHRTAELLIQVLPTILQVPQVIELMGTQKLYELLNAIMRNLGSGLEFKLSALEEEQSREETQQDEVDNATILQALEEMSRILAQVASQGGDNAQQIQELQQVADDLLGGADRREKGQRIAGGEVEPVPTQGTPPGRPAPSRPPVAQAAPIPNEDPFAAPEGTAQQRPNPNILIP